MSRRSVPECVPHTNRPSPSTTTSLRRCVVSRTTGPLLRVDDHHANAGLANTVSEPQATFRQVQPQLGRVDRDEVAGPPAGATCSATETGLDRLLVALQEEVRGRRRIDGPAEEVVTAPQTPEDCPCEGRDDRRWVKRANGDSPSRGHLTQASPQLAPLVMRQGEGRSLISLSVSVSERSLSMASRGRRDFRVMGPDPIRCLTVRQSAACAADVGGADQWT